MARFDMHLGIGPRLGAFVFMFAAVISAVSHGFFPSRWTELFLWISINFFVLDKVTGRTK